MNLNIISVGLLTNPAWVRLWFHESFRDVSEGNPPEDVHVAAGRQRDVLSLNQTSLCVHHPELQQEHTHYSVWFNIEVHNEADSGESMKTDLRIPDETIHWAPLYGVRVCGTRFHYLSKEKWYDQLFFQTHTQRPWLTFCEEHISEHIFNDHPLYTPPTHLYYIQGVRVHWTL